MATYILYLNVLVVNLFVLSLAVPMGMNMEMQKEPRVQSYPCLMHRGIVKQLQLLKQRHAKFVLLEGAFDILFPQCKANTSIGASVTYESNSLECGICCKITESLIPVLASYKDKIKAAIVKECDTLPEPTKSACVNFANKDFPKLWNEYFSDPKKMATMACGIINMCPLHSKC